MITQYIVCYEDTRTGMHVEFSDTDFTLAQATGAADAIISSPWVNRAWVEKRVHDFVSMQTVHIARPH